MRTIIILLLLAGCASDPYVDMKVVWQHNGGSDWMLQPERDWIQAKNDYRVHVNAGFERNGKTDCPYVEAVVYGPYRQAFVGCSHRFGIGKHLYVEPSLVHQVDSMTSDFLRTDISRQPYEWQGHNPFVHLRIGLKFNSFRCPVYATGMSLHAIGEGKVLHNDTHVPDLYWTDVECGVRLWGNDSE